MHLFKEIKLRFATFKIDCGADYNIGAPFIFTVNG